MLWLVLLLLVLLQQHVQGRQVRRWWWWWRVHVQGRQRLPDLHSARQKDLEARQDSHRHACAIVVWMWLCALDSASLRMTARLVCVSGVGLRNAFVLLA